MVVVLPLDLHIPKDPLLCVHSAFSKLGAEIVIWPAFRVLGMRFGPRFGRVIGNQLRFELRFELRFKPLRFAFCVS